ncbi:DHH family phosphoesterase [Candidatus Mycoplasma mahonii]|uniref:DHH family phosphoesterase n=1 Tax=Candidatus Mycoplasma mahonii TaxID=3004105 RepID=UPI0026E9B236|nr:DHH family phosphoesterase [Candidatus Mycoplasma mahonii]WKX02707.1 DHH family phosphoesterase [Candidatus Mycoplasma mahonii]
MRNKNLNALIVFVVFQASGLITLVVLSNMYLTANKAILFISLISILVFANFIVFAFAFIFVNKRREKIKKSFDYYIDYMVASVGVGLISYNGEGDIIWTSKFIDQRIDRQLVGKKLINLSESFKKEYEHGRQEFQFMIDETKYEVQINLAHKSIVLKDVTNESVLLEQYTTEKLVIGELEIDNFQEYQLILPPEELFRIESAVINMLDDLSEKYLLSYRQYVKGKFLITTNNKTLSEFEKGRFNFLDVLRNVNVIDGIKLSVSIGFGTKASNAKRLASLAKDGLLQAQSRGGDQVGCVADDSAKPIFYGSKSEIAKSISRIKIKQVATLFEKSISDKKIMDVVIFGHDFADLDAIGAALGIAAIAKTYKKNIYIQNVNIDGTTINAMKDSLSDVQNKYFVKPSRVKKIVGLKTTIVVMVDISDAARTESPEFIDNVIDSNFFVFDHHRIGKLHEKILPSNSYITTNASSASEIVVELIQFMKRSILLPKQSAQMMLSGIFLDTMQFQKSTSSRTFEASAFLENIGAQSSISNEVLKLSEVNSNIIRSILTNTIEVKPGYFLASYAGEVPVDVISKAADEILRTSGRKAAFVVGKVPGKKEFKLSARSLETNVQIIAELVGGGGHFSAAAAVSKEPLNIFTDNVIQAIVGSVEGEK